MGKSKTLNEVAPLAVDILPRLVAAMKQLKPATETLDETEQQHINKLTQQVVTQQCDIYVVVVPVHT